MSTSTFADRCPNPAIGLILRTVHSLCRAYGYSEVDERAVAWLHRSTAELVEAVIGGDGAKA